MRLREIGKRTMGVSGPTRRGEANSAATFSIVVETSVQMKIWR